MKVLYITYENVYRTAILQAMVIKPLANLNEKYKINFTILSTLKNEERDAIYKKNKDFTNKEFKYLNILEFPKNLSSRQSILTFFLDTFRILRYSIKVSSDHDIIHCRGYGGAFIGYFTSLFSGKPFIFDMRGVLPEETVDVGKINKNGFKFKILKIAERILIRKAGLVFVVSNKFKLYVKSEFKKEEVININNPTDFSIYHSSIRTTEKINLIYSGSMQNWHLPELTLTYFQKLYQEYNNKVYLIFCTNDLTKGKELFNRFDLPEESFELVTVLPQDMPKYYMRAQIAFCLIKQSFSKSVCFPVKFSEYIASELMVIANEGIGDLENIISEFNCGIVLESDEYNESDFHKLKSLVELSFSSNLPFYSKDNLGFLDWKKEGVEKIYDGYLKLIENNV